jgi:hypothetical protein
MTSPDTKSSAKSAKASRGRRKSRAGLPESTVAIIDRLLLRPRSMSFNGEKSMVPTIDVIVLQLLRQEMSGSHRARKALLKYQEFANRGTRRGLEIRFAKSDHAVVDDADVPETAVPDTVVPGDEND